MAKSIKFRTAAGVAVFPHTFQAVKWDEKQNRSVPAPDGTYDCTLALSDAKDIAALKGYAKQCMDDAGVKKVKNLPWKPEVDKETGEETGRILFTFKQYATDRDGNARRLPHFDAKAKPYGADFRLTGGSTVRLAGRPQYYKQLGGGVRFLVDSIQVVKYVEFEDNPWGDESDDAVNDSEASSEEDNSPFDEAEGEPDF